LPKVMEVKPDAVVKLGDQDFPPEEWVEEVPKVYLGEYTEDEYHLKTRAARPSEAIV